MPTRFDVEVVSPDGVVFAGKAEMVALRTPEGELAFLAGHTPTVGEVVGGEVRVHVGADDERLLRVAAGFVEVTREKTVVIAREVVKEPAGR